MKNTLLLTTLSLSLLFGCSDNKPTLHVYNWSDYISMDVIQKFEAKYNCHVITDSFASNEEMYAKLKAGATGYDIIVPSSYQIEMMSSENIIEKLDLSKLPNVVENFDHFFDSQIIDTNLTYSVPYCVSYGGFMYSKENTDIKDKCSWNILTDKKYKMRFSLLDDMREVIGAGLMYNGYSINSTSQKEIDEAVKTVISWKENCRKFDAESYKTEVANGSSYIGHGYSCDSAQIILGDSEVEGRDDLGFILPSEGFSIAFDELAITTSSTQKDLAYKFIDFIYETDNAIENIEYICGPMPHKKALEAIDENKRKVLVPSAELIKFGQVIKNVSNDEKVQEMYNKAWDEIRKMN